MRVKGWLLLLMLVSAFAGLHAATRMVMCEEYYWSG